MWVPPKRCEIHLAGSQTSAQTVTILVVILLTVFLNNVTTSPSAHNRGQIQDRLGVRPL